MKRVVRSRMWSVVALVGGLVSVAATISNPDLTWLRLVGGAGVLLGLGQQAARLVLARRQGFGTFWIRMIPAGMLVVSDALWFWSGSYAAARPRTVGAVAFDLVPVLLGLAGLMGLIYLGRKLPLSSVGYLQASNLPGAPEGPPKPPRYPYGVVAALLGATTLVAFVLGIFGLPGWVFLAVAIAGGVLAGLVVVPLLRFMKVGGQVAAALRAYEPVYAMPYNGVAGFHVVMWSPFLERTGERYVVLTTDDFTFRRIGSRYSMPVVYSSTHARPAITAMFPPSVKAAFYVHNAGNRAFVKVRRVQHVFVHHGDSDKAACANPVSAQYDTLVVAGQAAIDRYAANQIEIPREKFQILGRPQTEEIVTVSTPISEVKAPKVLYAPTWQGSSDDDNYSSLLLGPKIVDALLARGATVIFRPHPAGQKQEPYKTVLADLRAKLKADAAATGRPHRWGRAAEQPTVAEMTNAVDAMVADVSGIVTDFMQSLKPFAMVATRQPAEEFRRDYPSSQSAYVVEGDLGNLDQCLDDMLGPDPLAELRVERRRYYLGGYDDGASALAFIDYVKTLAHPGPKVPAAHHGP